MGMEQEPSVIRPLALWIGHRGCAGVLPENTLSACQHAIAMGFDGMEIDVQLSSDGVVVVYHDLWIKYRCFTRSGILASRIKKVPVSHHSLAQLQEYEIGHFFYGKNKSRKKSAEVRGEKIPTIEKVLALVDSMAPSGFKVWIELKTSPIHPGYSCDPCLLANATMEVVRKYNLENQVVFLSFDWRTLIWLRKNFPLQKLGFLTHTHRPWRLGLQRENMADSKKWFGGYHPEDFGGSFPRMIHAAGGQYWVACFSHLTRREISEAHLTGIQVYAWTVNNRHYAHKLVRWGIDGIISDNPTMLV